MSADMRLQLQLCLSDAERQDPIWSLADTQRVTYQLEREINGITSNEQKRLNMEFFMRSLELEGWCKTTVIQPLRKNIEQRLIHCRDPKMHLVSNISESICAMDSGDNFTTDISDRQHIANEEEAL